LALASTQVTWDGSSAGVDESTVVADSRRMAERILLLADFMNLASRAWFVDKKDPRATADGRLVGVAFFVCTMTLKLIAETGATHVAFAFESREPTFRRTRYPAYKATRPDKDEGLAAQLDIANVTVGRMGWARYRAEGYEADDVLAALALQGEAAFDRVIIATGDKDLLSAVTERTTMLTPEYVRFTPVSILAKYGVTPARFVDRKALIGDSGDNYPGCPGIGEKWADKLLASYGSLDGIYAQIDEVPPPWRAKLEAGEAMARLSYELATLQTDIGVVLDPAAGAVGQDDRPRTIAWLRHLEMRTIIDRLPTFRPLDAAA
jgi:DNA polymerase-1